MARIRRTVALALLMLTAFGAAASAQTLKPARKGDRILVKQTLSGEELRGRLIELSPETLSLLVHNQRVDLPMDRVLRVDATRDSVLNGALIGAAVLGGLCALNCGQGLNSTDDLSMVVLANAGWGALFGALIDLKIEGRTPIYIKPAAKSGAALQVAIRF
jgi:hypothetical protein